MVPLLAQGHLNQLLHLAHLIASYGLPVHFTGSSTHNRQAKLRLHGWSSDNTQSNIHFHDFQLNFHPHQYSVPVLEASVHLHQPVSHLLRDLSEKYDRVIVIHDILMASVVQEVRLISNAEAYILNPISAFTRFVDAWENRVDDCKSLDLNPSDIPECTPSYEGSVEPEVLDLARNQYNLLGFESGWVHNTSRVVEGRYLQLLEILSSKKGSVKHFALGPLNPVDVKSQSLKWLDEQEKGSVIYVAFGSTTTLSDDQIKELANGLEKYRGKFLWVLKEADEFDVFEEGEKRRLQLPEGYEERVKGKGIVVRNWAPQLEILGHSSIGGFMSHCGWNSCMESISMGVPIIAWPMMYDQPRNATLVCEVLRIGIVIRDWNRGGELVMSDTIEKAVTTLMASDQGNEMKERAAKLSQVLKGSMIQGGASCLERDHFIAHITG